MSEQVIPEAAVEAALAAYYANGEEPFEAPMRAALEAAVPHMLAAAWDEAMKRAADVAWEHDGSASSAVSQIPNPYRPTP